MTYSVPKAAVRVMRDAIAEANAAGITDPDAAAQHTASALAAHGWYVNGRPPTRQPHTHHQENQCPTTPPTGSTSSPAPCAP